MMKRVGQFVIGALGVLFVLLGGVWFGGRWLLSFSVADYEGNVRVPGIEHPVEITFDEKGIPQVWAGTDRDALFAGGWLHASERLFQMELLRRMASGELSEVFGEIAYEVDLFQRKLGLKRLAKEGLNTLSEETRELLAAYCQGINAWIEQKTILPPEFVLLQTTPRPWTVLDCLTIMLYQSWFPLEELDYDSDYTVLLEQFGASLESQLSAPLDWSLPTLAHRSVLHTLFQQERFPLRMAKASNSWVVGPQKSTTGAALHASDPHLPIDMIPGFWYLMGIHSEEGLRFLGVTTPGLPFGVMGHNGSIAYAFTIAGIDNIDYYRYQRDPEHPNRILTEHGVQELKMLEDTIFVKGEKSPRNITIYNTDRGVIVEETATHVVALKWAGADFELGTVMASGIRLMKARDFSTFREVVTQLGALNVNWTYSDAAGNIGYQLGAPIPRRGDVNSLRYLAGEDPSTAWQGYYPLPETPAAYNPVDGWLASCNNRIVPDDWPYSIPGAYDPYRIGRAKELLSQQEKFSPQDLVDMQMDLVSGIAGQWKELLVSGAEQCGEHELARKLREWDGQMSLESELAALLVYWWEFLPQAMFEDELGEEWRKGGVAFREAVLTHRIQELIDDRRTPDRIETLEDIAMNALTQVLPKARGKTLRDISVFRAMHPLSEVTILDRWLRLNRGDFHLPGYNSTLDAKWMLYDETREQFQIFYGPSMRYVLDWADIDAFTIHTNLGQSGNPFSPHYDDFLDTWREGGRWGVPFSKERVYAGQKSLLTLAPLPAS